MNTLKLTPKKNFESNRLEAGILQLTAGIVIIVGKLCMHTYKITGIHKIFTSFCSYHKICKNIMNHYCFIVGTTKGVGVAYKITSPKTSLNFLDDDGVGPNKP